MEVHSNVVTVITPASEKPEDIDIDRAIESEKRAEASWRNTQPTSMKHGPAHPWNALCAALT